jgi:thioester reductase-like protein
VRFAPVPGADSRRAAAAPAQQRLSRGIVVASPTGMATHGRILLTGATGFVGGELLRRLLVQDRREIVCPVRAASEGAARERGAAALQAILGRAPTMAERARVHWLRADLEQPALGLTRTRRAELVHDLEEIFHCAASTRFDLSLEDARRVNVHATLGILDVAAAACARGSFRRLHHVSTAYVAGRAHGRVNADFLPTDDPRAFRNSYERTKAEAERWLRACRDRIPLTIYRPSIIVGDSRTGRTANWNVVYFPMRLMAAGRLPFVPAWGAALLDCVPVDFVVDGLLALGRRPDTLGQGLHLTAGAEALTVPRFLHHCADGVARRRGGDARLRTRILGRVGWRVVSRLYGLVGGPGARRTLDAFAPSAAYGGIDTHFETARERLLLADAGVRLPATDQFFARAVDFALAHDFGRAAALPTAPPAAEACDGAA